MYGCLGFADSPRPWLMMCVSWATVRLLPTVFSAGTAGSTPPLPCGPWHWTQANWVKMCAPAATCGDTLAGVAAVELGPTACVVIVVVRSPLVHSLSSRRSWPCLLFRLEPAVGGVGVKREFGEFHDLRWCAEAALPGESGSPDTRISDGPADPRADIGAAEDED